jgi:alpha-glucoside transport system substrate-binding protein
MGELGAHLENYDQGWADALTYEGEVYGVFVKSDIKSTMWYSPVAFEAAGYEVPETWDDLVALADQMVADGNVPFSMGMGSDAATGWTATDTVQDMLMRTAGVDFVGGLATGDSAWNDPQVAEGWEAFGAWATDEAYALGGADGTVSTGFIEAITLTFADPPQAYMVRQSGFAGGVVAGEYPELEFGTDYDFFILPSVDGSAPPVQVGGDAMAVFNDTPAVRAVVDYLTSAEGGKAWAASGFDLSPNSAVTGSDYTDALSAQKADALANAPAVSFDVGDLMPGGLNMLEFESITAYVNGGDLAGILDEMEARAAEAHGG